MSDITVRVAQPDGRARVTAASRRLSATTGREAPQAPGRDGMNASDTRREIEQPPCQRRSPPFGPVDATLLLDGVKGADRV